MEIEQLKAVSGLVVNVLFGLLTPLAAWVLVLVIRELRREEQERRQKEVQSRHGHKWPDPSRN